ncbi:uncharacterized protein LOC111343138 isoform X1 [Stylophora pistillata]|uniref:uncharacterized protein LOC111343138 isoform X1 n=1 Tax=Stylophora pistillata TaxID=50429 RepID=UPI000C043528|nr:uncharacterized protein LOC111343138 isoform X1 [Stylophora pistillata]XP_022806026.1 uncharacterized protein LOC111343138 isoform X1 [Stylophora pistillata]XP_022806027.1 uncharacterized protein LOC111343138 isoform X1 [Stylophora pistillata]
MTSVKIYFRQTVFVSLVVSLLFYSVYAQEVIERKVCANVYAAVGKTVCDDNATCLEGDGAISCECEEGALGDGWAISSGCVEVEGPALDYSGVRDKRWLGSWSKTKEFEKKPCTGRLALLGEMICHRNAYCMQGYSNHLSMKCLCKNGLSGNGFRNIFSLGSGCH